MRTDASGAFEVVADVADFGVDPGSSKLSASIFMGPMRLADVFAE